MFAERPGVPPPTVIRKWPQDIQRFSFQAYHQGTHQLDLESLHGASFHSSEYLSGQFPQAIRIRHSRVGRIFAFFRVIQTFGITAFYSKRFLYDPSQDSHDGIERGSAMHSYLIWNNNISQQINNSWKGILGLASVSLLTSVLGLFQLLPACNNVIFSSLVLASFVLTWSSVICGTLYAANNKNFSTPRIADKWRLANSHNSAFWRAIALPLILLAWGALFCFSAILYVSFTGFSATQPTTCGSVNFPPVIGGLFVLGVFLTSFTLIRSGLGELLDSGV